MSQDVIVIGLGGMGSAAAYHLSRRGHRVLGLDAHPRGHTRGSSHGQTRTIREAYREGPQYVPLVQRAYDLWRDLEEESGRDLLTITGMLTISEPDSSTIEDVVRSAQRYDIAYEELSGAEVADRFPAFHLDENLMAILEPGAGILVPEACVAAHLDLAANHEALLRHDEPVRRWEADENGVRVKTDRGVYEADALVIAAGPWAGDLLADLGLPLSVERVMNVFFEPLEKEPVALGRCPTYSLRVPEGAYYGFPAMPDVGVKFGRHDGREKCTVDTVRREVSPEEIVAYGAVLERYLPPAAGPVKRALTCLYTMTPDGHFIIDHHSKHDRVVYGCGFSGHGFKFSSVVGEVLADLATEGKTAHPVGFMSAARFLQGTRP